MNGLDSLWNLQFPLTRKWTAKHVQVCMVKKTWTCPLPYRANFCLSEAAVRGLILSGYPKYTKKKIGHLLCHHKCCIFSLDASHGGLLSFPELMESNSFHVGQILEVLLRDGSDLEGEGSEEECLKFKKVIWTVFIMSFRRKAVS